MLRGEPQWDVREGLSHAATRRAGDGTTPIGDYGFVFDFNHAHPVFGRGSGIFLHVSHHSPTAGCVSLPEADLLGVLRWMRPGVRILTGPTRWLRSLKSP
jgi:L,D-peptidoglycan transpeptidase YkuD (ErfK/YbiS/YcfS/YnhG family)